MVFKGLQFGEKIKNWLKVVDTSFNIAVSADGTTLYYKYD